MVWVIAIVVALVVVVAIFLAMRSGANDAAAPAAGAGAGDTDEFAPPRPAVAEFHVRGERAMVNFDVPIGADDVDPVLASLLESEAVEVVREKRHSLPIADVTEVVALARRGDDWVEVGSVSLATPGELPPVIRPELIPHARFAFDALDEMPSGPGAAPGLAERPRGEELGQADLRMPASVEAGLRAQGIDPLTSPAGDIVLGLMRLGGYAVVGDGDTHVAARGGERIFVRSVAHQAGGHPELDEASIRRFVVDFGQSGANRGLLVTQKYGPFEIYDRERRDKRMRFITRERLQHFVDALSLR